jgi:hypothetical protein
MTPSNDVKHELCEILWRIGDGSSTPDDVERLESLIGNDPNLQALAARFAAMCGMLHWDRGFAAPCECRQDSAAIPTSRIPPTNAGNAALPSMVSPSASGWFASGWPVAYLVATVIFAVGLAIGALVRVSGPTAVNMVRSSAPVPAPVVVDSSAVARITGMVDCEWEGSDAANQKSEIINHKSLLRLGDRIALKSGLMELSYCTGANVVLQGPVRYEVESAFGGYLSVGKLTARLERSEIRGQKSEVRGQKSEVGGQRSESVNQNSEIGNQKFFVRTPTALVTDLGTEFGVEVDKQGATRSHVFRGSVRVQRISVAGTVDKEGRVLYENSWIRVSDNAADGMVVLEGARSADFVRDIPQQTIKVLDLVDVVAGGDGFSGKRDRGIDPTSGHFLESPWRLAGKDPPRFSDGQYHRVAKMPFVDGVFIPSGAVNNVQVDSAGHVFDGFQGMGNSTWQPVWAGGATIWPDGVMPAYPKGLHRVDFGSAGHGMLSLHANNAITFDLDAVRRAHPSDRLLGFRAVTAKLAVDQVPSWEGEGADVWVLVDGEPRFRRKQITSVNGVYSIAVSLDRRDRYLTLAATDGGNGPSCDWIVFCDPRLVLGTAQPVAPTNAEKR